MSKAKEWINYPEAIAAFSQKYVDEMKAKSIFWHCVEQGFIRARIWNGIPRSAKLPAAFRRNIDENCIVEPSLWHDMISDSPETNFDESKFRFELGDWGEEARGVLEGVEFDRKQILRLFSRAGVGGRPFQKDDWMVMTLTILEMALKKELRKFSSKSELQNVLFEVVNGAADDNNLELATFDRPTEQVWNLHQRLIQEAID